MNPGAWQPPRGAGRRCTGFSTTLSLVNIMSHPLQAPSESSTLGSQGSERVPSGRLFIFDAGWQTSVKATSLREFCTTMTPGQDFYHSLLANEIYVHHGTEKLCLNCAIRRGIVVFEARKLREAIVVPRAGTEDIPLDVDLGNSDKASADSGRREPLL